MVTPSRVATRTIAFVDHYCFAYIDIFDDVRTFESFKYLHIGMLSSLKPKSLSKIAEFLGLKNSQNLHHFIKDANWDVEELKKKRINKIKMLMSELDIVLVIDESGDKKRGNNTNYVVRQYLGNFEKIENCIVALTAYAIINGIYYPLIFKVFKPQEALQDQDIYKTKLELKIEIIEELKELGFNIRLILTDTLINEVELISEVLDNLNLKYILALRSNLQDLLETEFTQKLYNLNWETYKCNRCSHPGTVKYINSSIDSQSKSIKYYKFKRDYCLESDNTDIYYLKTNSSEEAKNIIIETDWIEYLLEYKFKEAKDKLGWADFRFTNYHSIERWWEIIMSAQLLQSIQSSYYYLDALESARYKLFKSL